MTKLHFNRLFLTKTSLSIAAILCSFCLTHPGQVKADEVDNNTLTSLPTQPEIASSETTVDSNENIAAETNPTPAAAVETLKETAPRVENASPDSDTISESVDHEAETSDAVHSAITINVPSIDYNPFAAKFELNQGEKIGDHYNPEFLSLQITNGQTKNTFTLRPSRFVDSQNRSYSLAELRDLTLSENETFTVKQFDQKIDLAVYIIDSQNDGREKNIELGNLVVRKDNQHGEIVKEVDFSAVNYFDVEAQNGDKPVREGYIAKTFLLDHLKEDGQTRQKYYWNEHKLVKNKEFTTKVSSSANSLVGGYYTVRTEFPNYAWIAVSDASKDNPVDITYNILVNSFQDHSYFPTKGQKVTLKGVGHKKLTEPGKLTDVYWQSQFDREYENDRPADKASISFYLPDVVTERKPVDGQFTVLGRATSEVTFPELEGYTKFIRGNGTSEKNAYIVNYYKNVALTFDAGAGALQESSNAQVNGLHTKNLKSVMTALPEVKAPEGYRFVGWTINDAPVSLDYVVEGTTPLTFLATYEKVETLADQVSVNGKVEIDNGVALTDDMIKEKVSAPEGASLTVGDKPDTTIPGEYTVPVTIQKGEETTTVNVPVTVKDTHRITTEAIKPIEVTKGAKDIPYADALPQLDTIASIEPPLTPVDTDRTGDTTADVVVVFTDGHRETVTIPISVVEPAPSLADLVSVNGKVEIDNGVALTDDMIKEKVSAPEGASLTVGDKPDTTIPGEYTVPVTIQKGEETTTVNVPVIVKEKVTPQPKPSEGDSKPGVIDHPSTPSDTPSSSADKAPDKDTPTHATVDETSQTASSDQTSSSETTAKGQGATAKLPQTGATSILALGLALTAVGAVFSFKKQG